VSLNFFFLKLTRIQGGHNVFITKVLYESRYQILCEKFKNKKFGLMCQNYNFIFSKHFKVIADKLYEIVCQNNKRYFCKEKHAFLPFLSKDHYRFDIL
jgi:hypothetical protein